MRCVYKNSLESAAVFLQDSNSHAQSQSSIVDRQVIHLKAKSEHKEHKDIIRDRTSSAVDSGYPAHQGTAMGRGDLNIKDMCFFWRALLVTGVIFSLLSDQISARLTHEKS